MAGSDEATIRIVLQGEAEDRTASPFTAAPSRPAPMAPLPPRPSFEHHTDFTQYPVDDQPRLGHRLSSHPGQPLPANYPSLLSSRAQAPTAPPVDTPKPHQPFDPTETAKKHLETDKARAKIDEEYRHLTPPSSAGFDPVKEAKRWLEADKRRAAIEAEYKKLVPPEALPAFDPYAEAQKRREAQRRAAKVDLAYKDTYGDENAKTPFDAILKVVDQLRGTIGGLSGVVVGSVLDIVSGFQAARAELEADKAKVDLANEGDEPIHRALPSVVPPKGIPLTQAPDKNEKVYNTTPVANAVANVKTTQAAEGAELLGDATTTLGTKMSAAVPVIGAFVAAAALGAKTLLDTISGMEQRYGDYSPDMAQAQALAEVRREMNNLRRAQDMGPEMARFIEMKSNLQEKYEEIKVKIMVKLLPIITMIGQVLEGSIMPTAEAISMAIQALTGPLSLIASSSNEIVSMQRDDRLPNIEDPTALLRFANIEMGADASSVGR